MKTFSGGASALLGTEEFWDGFNEQVARTKPNREVSIYLSELLNQNDPELIELLAMGGLYTTTGAAESYITEYPYLVMQGLTKRRDTDINTIASPLETAAELALGFEAASRNTDGNISEDEADWWLWSPIGFPEPGLNTARLKGSERHTEHLKRWYAFDSEHNDNEGIINIPAIVAAAQKETSNLVEAAIAETKTGLDDLHQIQEEGVNQFQALVEHPIDPKQGVFTNLQKYLDLRQLELRTQIRIATAELTASSYYDESDWGVIRDRMGWTQLVSCAPLLDWLNWVERVIDLELEVIVKEGRDGDNPAPLIHPIYNLCYAASLVVFIQCERVMVGEHTAGIDCAKRFLAASEAAFV